MYHQKPIIPWLSAVVLLTSACSPSGPQSVHATPHAESTTTPAETCVRHGAATELCFICDPELRDEGRLWCAEHDRYEDRCFLCHPELLDPTRLWCDEHSLYEDECIFCHPDLLASSAGLPARSSQEPDASELMCVEHGVLERECGICHPELLAQCSPEQGLRVRLASTNSAAMAGVTIRNPEIQSHGSGIDGFAELEFDQNRVAEVTSRAGGVIRQVDVDLGDRIDRGTRMASITSAAIGEAQGSYLRSRAHTELAASELERQQQLLSQQISSRQQFQEAEAAHRASTAALWQDHQRLLALGFDEPQINALAELRSTPGVLELRAPFAGEVIRRSAVQGAVVESTDELFTLADTSVLWAMVSIPESQIARVSLGQDVELAFEALPGFVVTGKLTWLSPMVDQRTRQVRGRAEIENTDGLLKAHMFARARIITDRADRAVVVPSSALHDVSGTRVVFLRSGEDLFEARPVTLGGTSDGLTEVVDGLSVDDAVVVSGGFALKSQLLASRLGAGCVDG